jgi:hypothetical protein
MEKSNSSFSMWMLRQFERNAIVLVVDQNYSSMDSKILATPTQARGHTRTVFPHFLGRLDHGHAPAVEAILPIFWKMPCGVALH